jgi:hypothetical protein
VSRWTFSGADAPIYLVGLGLAEIVDTTADDRLHGGKVQGLRLTAGGRSALAARELPADVKAALRRRKGRGAPQDAPVTPAAPSSRAKTLEEALVLAEVDCKQAREQLASAARRVREAAEDVLKRVESGAAINPRGELQGLGPELDRCCAAYTARLEALEQLRDLLPQSSPEAAR